jgi:hypothetical protein
MCVCVCVCACGVCLRVHVNSTRKRCIRVYACKLRVLCVFVCVYVCTRARPFVSVSSCVCARVY